MPKKKQVTFQNSIQGKFIPRNDPPPGSGLYLLLNYYINLLSSTVFTNNNRFNARMAELLASSTVNNENELVSIESPRDNPSTITIPESSSSSNMHSKLLNRRIVNMLETLKKPNDDSPTLLLTTSRMEHKSQPITFGQLRQGAISSSLTTIVEDKSNSQQQIKIESEEKHQKTLTSFTRDSYPDLSSKSSANYQTNKERFYYSQSLEQLFEKQNVISQTKKEEEQQSQKTKLTVDEILAMYYSKINPSTNTESHLPASTGFYIHPSGPRWNTLHNIPPPPSPSPLVLNEQNRNRPPPPSYSSSVPYGRRTPSTGMY